MIDPIEILKAYDRFRYAKDAAGHAHDPANGQFTGGGGEGSKSKEQIIHERAMAELKLGPKDVKGAMVQALHKKKAQIRKEMEEQEKTKKAE